ncbi:thiopeptide-type bacteriocin biosynthesis protein [Curtobacterium sp. HSID17257]|uniref:thiopeptide-type bacteriocin biosynthesis protein n=1 Tax=Curtobacterium sp. HSID17257 TaxID=2419510 RepID=UPI0013874F09|nr:thiopeptide-type bacteriocin biosynthesis protein [Curtobacterium sp. HSID17257]
MSLHVFHQGDLDHLVTDVSNEMRPYLPGRGQMFFLRYWNGGPHIRFRFRLPGRSPAAHSELLARVQCVVRDVLDRRPSTRVMTQADYEEQATILGQHEGVVPEPRLASNDTYQVRAYVPETDRYGTGESLAAVEDHFTESSALALRLLERTPSAEARALLAFKAAVISNDALHAAGHPELLADRSNVDASADPAKLRSTARSARNAVSQGLNTGLVGPEFIWHRSVTSLIDRLGRVERAELPASTTDSVPRMVDLCTHLFCNRIGVDIQTEGLVRTWVEREQSHQLDDANGGEAR